jgi:hypothetical protein
MTARETKATRGEAAKAALKETAMMVLPALIVAPTILWFSLHSAAPTVVTVANLAVFVGFLGSYIGGATFAVTYLRIRSEPTRTQVEDTEREKARALLNKYPDLKDS